VGGAVARQGEELQNMTHFLLQEELLGDDGNVWTKNFRK